MKFKQLYCSSTSACFEFDNHTVYYSDKPYQIILDGVIIDEKKNTNVFSIYNLKPKTKHTVSTTLGDFKYEFETKSETACINVKDFGAKGDGVTDDTEAFHMSIACCPVNGRVYVPEGTYLIAPIILKSDMTLEITKGATLLGRTEEEKYPLLPGEVPDAVTGESILCSTWEGNMFPCRLPFVSAFFAKNIHIVGEGVLDGNAQNSTWWINHRARAIGRPRLFFTNQCQNVYLHGITGQNSASWNFHPFFSQNVNFFDTRVFAPADSPNTDGCDPESCYNVNIIGMVFSVGDDAIAIKSGKFYMGMKYKTPASNHTIRNCLMQYAHGGVVLGSEMSGGVKDLNVSRCLFSHTDRGLRIKTRRGRGKYAVIDDITFEDIKMVGVKAPLVINMFYFCDPDGKTEYVWSKEKYPVDDRTPYIGKFLFKDIVCEDCHWCAGYFYGLPEQTIKEVVIKNVAFKFADNAESGRPAMMSFIDEYSRLGLYFNNVDRVKIDNVTLEGVNGEKFVNVNVPDFEVK